MKEFIRKIYIKIIGYKFDEWDIFKDYRWRHRDIDWPIIFRILWLQSNKCYHIKEDLSWKEYSISQEELLQNRLIEQLT